MTEDQKLPPRTNGAVRREEVWSCNPGCALDLDEKYGSREDWEASIKHFNDRNNEDYYADEIEDEDWENKTMEKFTHEEMSDMSDDDEEGEEDSADRLPEPEEAGPRWWNPADEEDEEKGKQIEAYKKAEGIVAKTI